jgi:hypothetical protein
MITHMSRCCLNVFSCMFWLRAWQGGEDSYQVNAFWVHVSTSYRRSSCCTCTRRSRESQDQSKRSPCSCTRCPYIVSGTNAQPPHMDKTYLKNMQMRQLRLTQVPTDEPPNLLKEVHLGELLTRS